MPLFYHLRSHALQLLPLILYLHFKIWWLQGWRLFIVCNIVFQELVIKILTKLHSPNRLYWWATSLIVKDLHLLLRCQRLLRSILLIIVFISFKCNRSGNRRIWFIRTACYINFGYINPWFWLLPKSLLSQFLFCCFICWNRVYFRNNKTHALQRILDHGYILPIFNLIIQTSVCWLCAAMGNF